MCYSMCAVKNCSIAQACFIILVLISCQFLFILKKHAMVLSYNSVKCGKLMFRDIRLARDFFQANQIECNISNPQLTSICEKFMSFVQIVPGSLIHLE